MAAVFTTDKTSAFAEVLSFVDVIHLPLYLSLQIGSFWI
jgi:hypothetical protein